MSSSVKESKKRKLDDADEQKQGRSKRQLIQNTLQYFFSKTAVKTTTQKDSCDDIVDSVPTEAEKIESTTCPMCSTTFENVIIAQYESHVNSCLDTADASSSDTIKQQVDPIPKPNQETASISWSKIFTAATFKIRGIWSHHKNDTAPGLNESETSWFGEPKYSSTTTATIPRRRLVPYYKRLAGTKMVVDAFTFGEIPDCEGYLLSHFHSDHYMGLSPNWIHGPIYCSEITARLVEQKLGVASDFIFPLPMNTPCTLPGTDQLTVTLMDANHCPGAVLFLVTTKDNLRYLHTGDFRACPKMCLHPMLKEQPLDIVYLDTTYLDPKYSFPSQDSCIQTACELVRRHNGVINNEDLSSNGKRIDHWFTQEKKQISSDHSTQHTDDSSDKNHRLLVVVGTYSLGKENIFIEIAKTLGSKIFVTDQKRAILETFHDQELSALLTDQCKEAQVHVIPLGHIQAENLEAYFHSLQPYFTQMIAFRPTGWTFRASSDPQMQQQQRSLESIIRARPPDLSASTLKPIYDTPLVKIFGVPYSEHSSFRELALFIASLDIRRIVPTVNVYSEKSRLKMSLLFEKWHRDKIKLIQDNGGEIKVVDYPSVDHW
ncbi:DNA repair metallo-beta-lactamase-domain-containing protein [Mucor lusitanicus]|uniref:DNA repair metallo-beta-lactamase-domain-containing protein n=1 Tax=Mucor circinelloides f. lusitanicus TaxID=29924 RepID=A0A8H4BU24_MUCCL|nr:DNA repair metallo-beta-lactamase-domain-containing protein [Mucor lusitanicus]